MSYGQSMYITHGYGTPSGTFTGKKVKIEKKTDKLLSCSPVYNITLLNDLIYAGAKLACNKIEVPLRNMNRNTKLGWENKLEGQFKKFLHQAKERG